MIQRLVVAPQAEAELRDAFIWYEQRSAGLGRDFLLRIEVAFELISTSPQLFRERHGPYRMAPTQRFPYAIYFIWDEDHRLVSVRRILHFKQSVNRPYE